MPIPYTPPKANLDAFNCPHCSAFSHMSWQVIAPHIQSTRLVEKFGGWWSAACCSKCKKYSVWHHGELIWPEHTGIEPANEDLSEEIKSDYTEAASIVRRSPRGAA